MLHIFSLRNLALCLRTRAEDSENTDHEHERGSAIVEFLGLGITLLLPIMYGVLTIFSVQASILGAHAASALNIFRSCRLRLRCRRNRLNV